jgi:hypothetical protein
MLSLGKGSNCKDQLVRLVIVAVLTWNNFEPVVPLAEHMTSRSEIDKTCWFSSYTYQLCFISIAQCRNQWQTHLLLQREPQSPQKALLLGTKQTEANRALREHRRQGLPTTGSDVPGPAWA